jgi:hypothetical protein
MDGRELLMSMERALDARSALKDFFRAAQLQGSMNARSHETALLEKVDQTRREFEVILGEYVDERIKSALSR